MERKFRDTDYFFVQLLHVRLELVVLVLHGVEKQALGQVGAALGVVHLVDQMLDLPDHVLERSLELPPGGDLLIERFHDREQIAVERDRRRRWSS